MYSDIQKIYQLIDILSKRVSAIENKGALMVDDYTQFKSDDAIQVPSSNVTPTIPTSSSALGNYDLMQLQKNYENFRLQNQSEQISKELSSDTKPNDKNTDFVERCKIKSVNSLQNDNALNHYNKTYFNLFNIQNLQNIDQDTNNTSHICKAPKNITVNSIKASNLPQNSNDNQAENDNESINRLNQMKKIGLQDMATNKITKMIKNHSILKESINTPFSVTNKVKTALNTSLSADKFLARKYSNDNLRIPTVEQKSICLNTTIANNGGMFTSRKSVKSDYNSSDSFTCLKPEEARIKREKEMAINRREKTREISLQNRKQASQKKTYSKPKTTNLNIAN